MPPPPGMTSHDEPQMALSPCLRVCIHVVRSDDDASAENTENNPKHHVRLRRQQGGHWRMQAFYAAFRREMTQQLGLADEKQLSFYSPMTPKRTIDMTSAGPLSAWSRSAQEAPGSAQQVDISDNPPNGIMLRRAAKVPMGLLLAQAPKAARTAYGL